MICMHVYVCAGFALAIAIVAKCEDIIILGQEILIWRKLFAKMVAKEKLAYGSVCACNSMYNLCSRGKRKAVGMS